MTFEVHPGQVVALVGQSGGGKSTVVKLIEHFYELNSGRILLGEISTLHVRPYIANLCLVYIRWLQCSSA